MIIKKIIIAYGTTGKTKTNRFWSSVKTYKSLNISGLTWSFANMFALLSRRTSMVTRVTYAIFDPYVCPPIQEEGDGGMVTISSSHMESSSFIL
jgi:hypothetical protein